MSDLKTALGGMVEIAQWFLWRLEWNAEKGKYIKTPCALDGSVYRMDASLPQNWTGYLMARSALDALPSSEQLRYALGFWLTEQSGYWFLDLDAVGSGDNTLTEHAQGMVSAFPGAFFEWSSSGKGVHVIGRAAGGVPPHSTRPPRDMGLAYEFYSSGRGIAFGLTDEAMGNADTVFDVGPLVATYFPPRTERVAGSAGRRAEWRGPEDDDELIARALRAKESADVVFGSKPGFRKLWAGDCEHDSSSDMALASHLAFWTGADAERIERLMWRSGLVRDKWREHRTYLRELTIENACAGCGDVYQEPQRSVAAQQAAYGPTIVADGPVRATSAPVIDAETSAKVEELLQMVHGAGSVEAIHNEVIPACRDAGIPRALAERLVRAINKQLDIMDAKLPIGQLRALVSPPVIAGTAGSEPPLWVQRHCYVLDGDYFYDMENGAVLSRTGFAAMYNRNMPIKDNGQPEDAVDWALHRWHITTVNAVSYRPDMGPYFEWDGQTYANQYNENSVPAVEPFTEDGVQCIEHFKTHLYLLCGGRDWLYMHLLQWMAYNVQFPGRKIRHSPIIKGVPGDGKSILGNVLRAAMGWRNVGVTGNATLTNSGGFNDWAIGYAVNIIEEIMLTGKERHRLYNAMKEFISNNVVNINGKGEKSKMVYNTTNHVATTNHNDGIPLEDNDRRWLVIFSPYQSLADAAVSAGLTQATLLQRFKGIGHSLSTQQGQWRAWLLGVDTSTFDPDANAPLTDEKGQMTTTSKEDIETVALQIIEDGAYGITPAVISSACLTNNLKVRALQDGFDVPRGMALNHTLTRMGYSQISKVLKWDGKTHRIWVKSGISTDPDYLRTVLDGSRSQ